MLPPIPSRTRVRGDGAFTLVELLVCVSIIALLISILLPGLRQARMQAKQAVCGSNLRQIAVANSAYAVEYDGRYAPGSPRIVLENLTRWHGARENTGVPFDPAGGLLTPFFGAGKGIRACPSMGRFADGAHAFERGCGGYGYNQAYVGRVMVAKASGAFKVVSDETGVSAERIVRAGETLMFTDTAFLNQTAGLIEYSFAEPRFHPESPSYRAEPSIQFRHRDRANVAWCDGHVDARRRTFSWSGPFYNVANESVHIGWFGLSDDNSFFDLR